MHMLHSCCSAQHTYSSALRSRLPPHCRPLRPAGQQGAGLAAAGAPLAHRAAPAGAPRDAAPQQPACVRAAGTACCGSGAVCGAAGQPISPVGQCTCALVQEWMHCAAHLQVRTGTPPPVCHLPPLSPAARSTALLTCTSWALRGKCGCRSPASGARTSTASATAMATSSAAQYAPPATGAGVDASRGGGCLGVGGSDAVRDCSTSRQDAKAAVVSHMMSCWALLALPISVQAEDATGEDAVLGLPCQPRQCVRRALCRSHLRQLPLDTLRCVSGLRPLLLCAAHAGSELSLCSLLYPCSMSSTARLKTTWLPHLPLPSPCTTPRLQARTCMRCGRTPTGSAPPAARSATARVRVAGREGRTGWAA